jgi:hypothetical protein
LWIQPSDALISAPRLAGYRTSHQDLGAHHDSALDENRSGMTARHLIAGEHNPIVRQGEDIAVNGPVSRDAARAILEMGLETTKGITNKPLISLASPTGFEPVLPP